MFPWFINETPHEQAPYMRQRRMQQVSFIILPGIVIEPTSEQSEYTKPTISKRLQMIMQDIRGEKFPRFANKIRDLNAACEIETIPLRCTQES